MTRVLVGSWCILGAVSSSDVVAQGRPVTGEQWLRICDGSALGAAGEFGCLSYLAGIIEFAGTMIGSGFSRHELQDKFLGCMPDNISMEQLRLVVIKYLREHRERLHLSFSQLVTESLRGSFRC
jgi:hypothetical protein